MQDDYEYFTAVKRRYTRHDPYVRSVRIGVESTDLYVWSYTP